MTERPKWWKAFLPKKKSSGPSKDAGSAQTIDSDYDPFASDRRDSSAKAASDQSQSQQDPKTNIPVQADDTFDDSHMESLFNEQTCRRKFNISRSGRFKDKQRIRSTIPTKD